MVLLRYLGLSGLGIALFYLVDRLVLRKSTLLKTQRYYFIIAIVSSLALPLLAEMMPSWQSRVAEAEIPTITITLEDEFVITPDQNASIDWWAVGRMIWIVGVVISGLWMMAGWVKIWQIQRRSTIQRLSGGVVLFLTQDEFAPFTIGKRIYIPQSLKEPKIIDSIMLHELEHIQQRHYIDMLLGLVLQLVQWWNPFAWSMLQQQRNTLEYLADQGVLRMGKDRKTYQYHLLECTIGRSVQLPSLSFSMQNLKQRIVMMNSNKKSRKSLAVIYAIAALPIVTLLLVGTQMVTIEKATAAEISEVAPPPTDEGEVFESDELPDFPGGMPAMMKWLGENIKYPAEAQKNNIQGRVVASFIVEVDGSISNVKIVRGIHELLDAEAMRVVSAMPKWKPGTKDGKAVRTRFTLPVAFSLRKKADQADAKKGEIYKYLKEMPNFPGGMDALMTWLKENMEYPAEAVKNKIEGRVFTSFVVEVDGSISNVKIVKSLHELLDAEAMRVVAAMPKWTPGKLEDGTLVRSRFTLPIQFKLTGNSAQTPKASDQKIERITVKKSDLKG